jgi:putative endonuclease
VSFPRVAAARGIPDLFRYTSTVGERSYYVYIMSSVSRTLYTGVSNDLERRVFEHKHPQPGSFTTRYRVNRLVYFETFGHVHEAIAREKEIKQMTRARKIRMIESSNPGWSDLAE